jgi:hypothetical protein
MRKPEGRSPKAERNPNSEDQTKATTTHSQFGFRPSFGLRIAHRTWFGRANCNGEAPALGVG